MILTKRYKNQGQFNLYWSDIKNMNIVHFPLVYVYGIKPWHAHNEKRLKVNFVQLPRSSLNFMNVWVLLCADLTFKLVVQRYFSSIGCSVSKRGGLKSCY